MSSIILGGGQSSRLGQDKISLVIAGESLFQRTISRLTQLGESIILVLAQDQEKPELSSSPEVKITTDLDSGKGPLAGIYSGLKISNDEYAVIPIVDGEVEPLHAVYSQNCAGVIETMLKQNDLKVRNMLKQVKVRYVEESEVNSFDPDHLSWFNINTPDDLQKAKDIMGGKRQITNYNA
jgi:molybdopterin-guanine dinucleotide biosynthesis protein A